MEKTEMLGKILADLKRTGGIAAAAIGSRDGLVIAGDMPDNLKPETLVAMSATMHGAAETATTELGHGLAKKVVVETEDGNKLITMGAGPKALLVVTITPEAGIGLILLGMEKAAKKIKDVLES